MEGREDGMVNDWVITDVSEQERASSVNPPCMKNKEEHIHSSLSFLSFDKFCSCARQLLTCPVFLLLAGPLANSQVDGRLFGGDGEFVHMLPPLGLEVLLFLHFCFLFLLELHLLTTPKVGCLLLFQY